MQPSQHYLFMEALMRRISNQDAEVTLFQEEFYRLQAGLSGEIKLKNQLLDTRFQSEHHVIYNFECKNERGFTHQMDALLLTPHFTVIFEAKQISGQFFYKPTLHEFSRITEAGKEENFPNPFDQALRHQLLIEEIFQQRAIHMPVLHVVIITNYRARLDQSLAAMPIFHLSGLPHFLNHLYETYCATRHSITELSALFSDLMQTLPPRRQIEQSRLKIGVFCQQCTAQIPLTFHHGQWRCAVCRSKSRAGVLLALHDYRILISTTITNKAFRQFTGIRSPQAAQRILTELNLTQHGKNKGRYYVIPEDILTKFE